MYVISDARKLVLRVPEDSPVVTFPEDAVISNYGVDNDSPQVVVCNGTEDPPSWQGVSSSTGVVLVNGVPGIVAEHVLCRFKDSGYDIGTLRHFLDTFTRSGYVDQYTTSHQFVADKLTPAGLMLSDGSGIMKRDDRDLVSVYQHLGDYYIVGSDRPQPIRPDALLDDYRMPDGSMIDLASIPDKE